MSGMLKKAQAIAAVLGEGWSARKGVWGGGGDAFLDGPNGERLHVRPGTRTVSKGRVEISGVLDNKFTRYNEPNHVITVSPDKAPARIAGDIERRLLPAYQEALAENKRRKAEHENAEAEKERTLTTLAGILPDSTRLGGQPDHVGFGGGKYGSRRIGGEVQFVRGGELEWVIRTNDERAGLALAELLYKATRELKGD
ncbi:hypothetical protein [Amycolatopsis anabasis]|uniref:hypothetical protein n=1 Tax=Amycolatopsis anabasis TaxID=1840409 RepID=UPI00131AD1C5|nr:hypothetical protein [Amycolatopsis anabasis]